MGQITLAEGPRGAPGAWVIVGFAVGACHPYQFYRSKGSKVFTKDLIRRKKFIKHKQICMWRRGDTLQLMGSQSRRKAVRRNFQGSLSPPLSNFSFALSRPLLDRKTNNGTSDGERQCVQRARLVGISALLPTVWLWVLGKDTSLCDP